MSAAKKTLSVGEARAKLRGLLDEASAFHGPILITGKGSNAILIAEEDWRAVEDTLYLLSVPGLSQSVRDGIDTPVELCGNSLDW